MPPSSATRPSTSEISCSATPIKSNLLGTARLLGSNVQDAVLSNPTNPSVPLYRNRPNALASAVDISSDLPPVGSLCGRLATAVQSADDLASLIITLRTRVVPEIAGEVGLALTERIRRNG